MFKCTCQCGHTTESSFPSGVNAPVGYGPNVQAIIAFLHTRQFIPFERMSEYFRNVCNLPINQSAIYDIPEHFAQKAESARQMIAKKVESATVVDADETGVKVNG